MAVPEDEEEDCELSVAHPEKEIEGRRGERSKDLLNTAKLITTFVPVTKAGNLTLRKLTILVNILVTVPLEEAKSLILGTFLFCFFLRSRFGMLAAEAEDEAALAAAICFFRSLPGLSPAIAIISGPIDVANLDGRDLTSVCTNGGIFLNICSRCFSFSLSRVSRSSHAVGAPLTISLRIKVNSE